MELLLVGTDATVLSDDEEAGWVTLSLGLVALALMGVSTELELGSGDGTGWLLLAVSLGNGGKERLVCSIIVVGSPVVGGRDDSGS